MKSTLIGCLILIGFNTSAQTIPVYVNDTTWKDEPVNYFVVDSLKGPEICIYMSNGNDTAFVAKYYNGRKTGMVKTYYPSGKLMMTTIYAKGKKNGEETIYNEEGAIMIKGCYVDGTKDGFWIYKNYGFMGNYKNGLKSGWWRQVRPDTSKVMLWYKNGKLKKSRNEVHGIPQSILIDGISTEQ